MSCNQSLSLKEVLNQLNLFYICICLYLQYIKNHGRRANVLADHPLGQKDILKFIYDLISYNIYFKYFFTVSTM
jgi:hypothetical protein